MFTGIVEELGVVAAVEPQADAARLTIECRTVIDDVSHGASIAVNGVCLTVTSFRPGDSGPEGSDAPEGPEGSPGSPGLSRERPAFTADVMRETLDRSGLGSLVAGDRVNLERPVRLSDRLGGHLVQGHVDGVGTVVSRTPSEHWDVVRIAVTDGLDRYLVQKGSVTVDGVSLTVVEVVPARDGEPASFTVSLIPTTLELTTLGRRGVGETVNIEVDVLAKYVEKLSAGIRDLNGSHR